MQCSVYSAYQILKHSSGMCIVVKPDGLQEGGCTLQLNMADLWALAANA